MTFFVFLLLYSGDSLTITSAHPQFAGANFALMTTFPNKELTDESVTVEDAKLLNAVLVQRMKWYFLSVICLDFHILMAYCKAVVSPVC